MRAPKKSHKNPTTLLIGSLSQIHGNGCVIVNAQTGERIQHILYSRKIQKKIRGEREAWKIICALRDRCVRPLMHNPNTGELKEFLGALRTLFLLLPPIKKNPGESNKTFLIRTLHDISRFRQIDMLKIK